MVNIGYWILLLILCRLQENPFCNFSDPNDGTRCFCEQFCSISGLTSLTRGQINMSFSCSWQLCFKEFLKFLKFLYIVSGSTEDSKRKIVIIAVVVSVTSLLILLVSLAALLYRNSKYKRYLQLQVQQSTNLSAPRVVRSIELGMLTVAHNLFNLKIYKSKCNSWIISFLVWAWAYRNWIM